MENFENDRVKWQQREADLYNQIRSISAANGDPRTPRRRSITANSLGTGSLQQYGSSLGNICKIISVIYSCDVNVINSILSFVMASYSRGQSDAIYVDTSC
jgi:hypothetical protein